MLMPHLRYIWILKVIPDQACFFGGVKNLIMALSREKNLNPRSSTEAKLTSVDDSYVLILWTKLFLEALGYTIKKNIIFQDNQGAILLVINGQQSTSKNSRALIIRYFFMTNQVEKGNANFEYCNKEDGEHLSKIKLQGENLRKFGNTIIGMDMFHIWRTITHE